MGIVDQVKKALMGEENQPTRGRGLKLRSWRPELPDPRDYLYAAPVGVMVKPEVSPLGIANRIHDQGMTSSCTGHAATAMLEARMGLTGDSGQLSRLFPYYLGREIIGETNVDAGAYNRDVVKSMLRAGVPPETYWRFTTTNITKRPTASAYHQAELMRQRIESQKYVYERVTSLDLLIAAISAGNPVMFGFLCYDNIFGLNSTKHVYEMPAPGAQPVGGHAVLADGYNKADQYVWVQNSWGTGWGKRGYFKMPFSWWTNPGRLVDDMWTMRPTA